MDPRQFIETRTKRYMAQALEDFETKLEVPLRELAAAEPNRRDLRRIVDDIEPVKRSFRKKLQTLAADASDLMPGDVEINALELVRRIA